MVKVPTLTKRKIECSQTEVSRHTGTRSCTMLHLKTVYRWQSCYRDNNTCRIGPKVPHPKPNTPIGAQVLFNFGAEQSSGDTRQREGLVCDWSNHHFDSGEHRCINVEHKQPLSHAYKIWPPWHSQRNINADCRGHDFDRPRQLPHTKLTLLTQLVCVPVEEFSLTGRFVKNGSVISSENGTFVVQLKLHPSEDRTTCLFNFKQEGGKQIYSKPGVHKL